MSDIISSPRGPKWAPQITVLLDDNARVLNVNRSLAGTSFDSISEATQELIHSQLHPGCGGKCRFNTMWNKAWGSLKSRDSVEWELDDPELRRLLRLNLSKTPAPNNVKPERRQRHKLLMITDITRYRREYETLVEQQQALIRLLMSQSMQLTDAGDEPFDDTGDTGNRLMAGYLKTERSLNRQLVLAQEKERKRIASELHDGIAQTIGIMKYRIEDNLARIQDRHPDLDLSMFDDTVDDIKGLIDEVRRISNNLSPSILEDFGVQVALEWLCKEFKAQNRNLHVSCAVRIDEDDLSQLVKVAIYRVAQEAFNNINKHALATRVDAILSSKNGGVELVIKDDGAGFDFRAQQPCSEGKIDLGLRSMRERVEATGGEFKLKSLPGQGVEVRAKWAPQKSDPNR